MRLQAFIRQLIAAAPSVKFLDVYIGDNQNAAASSTLPVNPAIQLIDASGAPVVGNAVTCVIESGGGSGTGLTGVTDSTGVFAVGSWTLGAGVGANTMSVHVVGALNSPLTLTATGTSTGATQVVVQAGSGQSGIAAGTVVPVQVVFRVKNAGGAGVQGVPVTFVVISGSGTLASYTDTSDVNGDVDPGAWTLGAVAGVVNTVECQAVDYLGVAISASVSTTSVLGPAAGLRFVQSPSVAGTSGVALPIQPIVQVIDAAGNDVVDTGNVVVTVFSGTLVVASGGTIALDGAGRATFTALTLTPSSGTGVLRFTRGTYHVDSPTITLAPPVPTQVRVVSQPTGAATGSLFTYSFEITDDNGTRVTNDSSTVLTAALIDNTEGATLTGLTATASSGLVTFSSSVNLEGNYRITADDGAGGLAAATTASFAITAAGAYPNKPSNYTTVLSIPGTYLPPQDDVVYPSSGGVGYLRRSTGYNANNLVTTSYLGQTWWDAHFPIGQAGGTSVCMVNGWNNAAKPQATGGPYYDNYYISFHFDPGGTLSDYENGSNSTKICMIGSGSCTTSGAQTIVPCLDQIGSAVLARSAWPLIFTIQLGTGSGVATYNKSQNLAAGNLIISGQDNQIEILMHQSSGAGVADGTLEAWVNGTKVMNYTNMTYKGTGMTSGFGGFKFYQNRTGISGGTRTRVDDFFYRDILVATL